jgi:hypothetical protein
MFVAHQRLKEFLVFVYVFDFRIPSPSRIIFTFHTKIGLLTLLELGLLYCKYFFSIKRLAYNVNTINLIIIKSDNFLSNTLYSFIFLLACGLVLFFWSKEEDTSDCGYLVFRYISHFDHYL